MQLQRLVVKAEQLQKGHVRLEPSQLHYLQRVLRLGVGDRFIAMDGEGHAWLATLQLPTDPVQATSIQATILEPITAPTELAVRVTLVAALPKGNGFDDVVRQSTELGVDQILPVISDRTLLNPSPQKLDRWQRIASEAAEQSERLCVPHITAPIPFTAHLQEASSQTDSRLQKYLCVARGSTPHLLNCLQASTLDALLPQVTIAIGPEGGWTEAEVAAAIDAGYQPVSLGSRILRAVTAPLVALSLIAAVWER
ncbi:MAG: 16S rRNA (uracil(1498)-N(3))-methyltransferase [Stenomitos frigidus ULC029]